MPKYTVKVPFSSTEFGRMWFNDVEADSPKEAIEKALESDDRDVKIDHNEDYEFTWDEAEVTEA